LSLYFARQADVALLFSFNAFSSRTISSALVEVPLMGCCDVFAAGH